MKKIFNTISLIILFATNIIHAQDLKNYNLYNQNYLLYNPASYVNDNYLTVYDISQLQWLTFTGAPRNYELGASMSFLSNMGAGISVSNFRAGLINNLHVNLKYAYKLNFDDNHFLKIGISAGINNTKLYSQDVSYVDVTDIILSTDYYNKTSFSSGFGLLYKFKNLEAQFMMPQLIEQQKINLYNIGLLAYNINLNSIWDFKPSVMVRNSSAVPTQFDANIMASWKKTIWSQVGFRTDKSLIFSIGVDFRNISIGYAYQANTNPISETNSGSHEIQLILKLNKKNDNSKNSKTNIYGKILNNNDNTPVKAKITVLENDIELTNFSTDTTGFYQITLKTDKTYKFTVKADGYKTDNELIITDASQKEIEKNINLKTEKTLVKGKVVNKFNNTGVASQIMFLDGNKIVENISTDNNGNYSVYLSPSKEYLLKVNAENYDKLADTIIINDENIPVTKDIELNPEVTLKGQITDSKSGKPIVAKIEIFDKSKNTIIKTFDSDVNGLFNMNISDAENITVNIKANNYLFYSENIAFDFSNPVVEKKFSLNPSEISKSIVLNQVHFEIGKSFLTNQTISEINNLIETMKQNPTIKVEISGHTDNTGLETRNKQLSQERADIVVDYMIKNGISKDRLIAIGYGSSKPCSSNETLEGRSKNRRIEATIISE